VLWRPDSELTDEQIDQFIIISRSVGTFARALDCSSSVKQPSLHMSAAAASRDITVFHAYQVIFLKFCLPHDCWYNKNEHLW
jgi:metastasis-associated protein MTA